MTPYMTTPNEMLDLYAIQNPERGCRYDYLVKDDKVYVTRTWLMDGVQEAAGVYKIRDARKMWNALTKEGFVRAN